MHKSYTKTTRQRQIDQENSLLLKKMLDIIQRKNQSFREGDHHQHLVHVSQVKD